MTMTISNIDELMQWAIEQSPNWRIRPAVCLDIGTEIWEAALYDYSHDAVVARVYIADPHCDHDVGYCECRPLAEKRLL